MSKVSIIGAGNLGAFIGYEIASRNLTNEIVFVDLLKDLAQGQALDISQSLPFKNKTKVLSGDYNKIKDSDIIILTAGKPRTPDIKDRLELVEINKKITGSILQEIKKHSPNSIIITVTNPMDIINHFIHKQGFSRNKIIGSGGQLDSARLRGVLGYPEKEVDAFVIGEHGHNQIPVFSLIKINGKNKEFTNEEKKEITEKLLNSSMQVLEKKKATVFAPASNTVDMVEAILKDQKKLMCCSVNLQGEYNLNDVSIGVPVILGKNGIESVVTWTLDEKELNELHQTANKLKKTAVTT